MLDLLNRGIRVKCGAPEALRIIPARGRHCEAENCHCEGRKARGNPFSRSQKTCPDSEFYEPAVSYKEPRNPVKVRRGLALPCPPSLFPCAISDGA